MEQNDRDEVFGKLGGAKLEGWGICFGHSLLHHILAVVFCKELFGI